MKEVIVTMQLCRSWRALVLRGVVAFVVGLALLARPTAAASVLVAGFGAYALFDGLVALAASSPVDARARGRLLVLEGLAGVMFGLAALAWTGATVVVLVDLVAAWSLLTGLLEVAAAAHVRNEGGGGRLLTLAGAASLTLGAALLAWPTAGVVIIATLLGGYALAFGAALIVFGVGLRRATLAVHDLGARPA